MGIYGIKAFAKSFIYSVTTITFFLLFISCCRQAADNKQAKLKELTGYVNPFIGTYKEGHTFPGACLPFGMIQLSPDNGYKGVKAYNYSQKSILGFSHTHLSGTGPIHFDQL